MKSIAIMIHYFGEWPKWVDVFFHSCEQNSSIDFFFFTDCEIKTGLKENLIFIPISFVDYKNQVSNKLHIQFNPNSAYKLCDLKPFYGFLHYDLIKKYDFYGFADIDLFFGDIRFFITDDILNNYHVISTHNDRISGHFSLFKNTEENRNKAFHVKYWNKKLEEEKMVTISENFSTRLYFPPFSYNVLIKKLLRRIIGRENVIKVNNYLNRIYKKTRHYRNLKIYFTEQYTTPLSYIYWIDKTLHDKQPDTWYYKDGKITNNRDAGRLFIYIHFMNFKSGRYKKDKQTLWHNGYYQILPSDIKKGIKLTRKGIMPYST